MLLAFRLAGLSALVANMPTAWEECKLVRRPRCRSLCHRWNGLTFELVTASFNPALRKDAPCARLRAALLVSSGCRARDRQQTERD